MPLLTLSFCLLFFSWTSTVPKLWPRFHYFRCGRGKQLLSMHDGRAGLSVIDKIIITLNGSHETHAPEQTLLRWSSGSKQLMFSFKEFCLLFGKLITLTYKYIMWVLHFLLPFLCNVELSWGLSGAFETLWEICQLVTWLPEPPFPTCGHQRYKGRLISYFLLLICFLSPVFPVSVATD